MPDGQEFDTVQHPTLGPLKFPKDMPFDERNTSIQRQLSIRPQTGGLPLYEFSPYSETRSYLQPPRAPELGMEGMRTPKSVASNVGQGLLDIPRGLPAMAEALAYPEKSIGEPQQQYMQQAQQGPWYSRLANIFNAVLAPTQIPQQVQGFTEGAIQNPERAVGQAAGMYAMGKIPSIPEGVRTGAQDYFRIGKPFIQAGAEEVGARNVEALAKHEQATSEALAGTREKINQARISEPQAFAEAEAKHRQRVQTVQQANAESQAGFRERQQHLDVADQHAQTISDRLPQVHQAAKAEARAAYGPQPKGTYDLVELRGAIEDTAREKLQGNTELPGAVKKIIADLSRPSAPTLLDEATVFKGAGKGMRGQGKLYSANEALADMDPKARQKYLASLSDEERANITAPTPETTPTGGPADAAKIHGYMSELGSAAESGALKPDEVSAIRATRSMLEGRLRKLYDNEGRLGDFQAGQAKWRQMANTFENTGATARGGSPIARALATRDPITGQLRPDYVQHILADDKAFPIAQQMLDRYRHLGAPTNELQVMKTHGDFADTLPSQVKWRPEPTGPKYPNFTEFGKLPQVPEAPTLAEYDPVEARKVALKDISTGMGSMKGIRGPLDILALARVLKGDIGAISYPFLRRAMSSGIGGEKVMNWLSRATPEELQMAKDIPAKAVALRKRNP